jgi:dGTPase
MRMSPKDRIKQYEKKILAPYACFSSESRGRQYAQKEHPLRTVFQRDRDRVIHSAAFRRMEYKTQVFVNHEGDHYRTRLTHTIEVAQISRSVARTLGLNEDLAEAIALVHDLGHTPFGHSGEEVLNDLLADFGGFNHNCQSLRVVDFLERRYPEYPGLNLTYEVREGIAKHETTSQPIYPEIFPPGEKPTLEASLVDIADAIAYNSHDIDDGLSSGILKWEMLDDIPLWLEMLAASKKMYPELDEDHRRYSMVRLLVNRQATDLIENTIKNIERENIVSLQDVRNSKRVLIAFSGEFKGKIESLKKFLSEQMYHHPHLVEMSQQAEEVIRTLFDRYKNNPEKLHGKYKLRLKEEPTELIIADFIAGMTDRYAYRMYDEVKQ